MKKVITSGIKEDIISLIKYKLECEFSLPMSVKKQSIVKICVASWPIRFCTDKKSKTIFGQLRLS